MKIAIDTQIAQGQKTGFGFYVQNLVENLKIIDHKNNYILINPKSDKDLSAPKRFVWDQYGFPRLALKKKVDIIHQPCFSAPVLHGRAKLVLTCHDIIGITFSKDLPFFSRQYFGKWMPFSYRYADKIICDSENTKNDLIRVLKIPKEKLKVIYLAASKLFKPVYDKNKIDEVKKKYQIKDKYFLYLGTLNPRKNIELIIKVFARIYKNYPGYQLIISGKKTWHYQNLIKIVNDLNLEDQVIFTDYVPDEDSLYLYNGSEIFLFPSLYEGFGLPPLEAMSCGRPVISSNATSLKEIIGDGGVLVSPNDEKSWIKNIERVIKNKIFKNDLEGKALQQVKKFSWKKCAEETLKIYEEVYENCN